MASLDAAQSFLITLSMTLVTAESTVVVGASRGLGLELARSSAAADPGAVVHATARAKSAHALRGIRGVVEHTMDVTNATQVAQVAHRIVAAGSAIDVLIHSAGINNGTMQRQMEVNAVAPFRIVDAFMPALLRSQHARVCIITSDRGQQHYVRKFRARFAPRSRHGGGRLCRDVPYCAYAVSKGAAHDTFRRLEPSWRTKGITAVVLHPGSLATDMNGGMARCVANQQRARASARRTSDACITAATRAPDIQRLCSSLTPRDAGKLLNWKREVMAW